MDEFRTEEGKYSKDLNDLSCEKMNIENPEA